MEQKADRQAAKVEKKPVALRKVVAIIVLGIVLLACLLALGYFGVKTFHRSQMRREAMAAYEKGDYEKAERLLRQYVAKDQNSEPEFVALANIYHEFGNTGREAQMWQTASSLNPLNEEYREKMLTSAEKAASYSLLRDILGRKVKINEKLSDHELYLYVISSYRSGYPKDGEEAYKKAVEVDPEAFHKNELGRMAEFMANYGSLSEGERDNFLNSAMKSEDPLIRFEALYTVMSRASIADDNDAEVEKLLKQIVETNYFAGTPLLADFYFSKFRFSDLVAIAEPYLKTIDDLNMSLLYAESCVFASKPDKLKAATNKLHRKNDSLRLLADYCDVLIAYMENNETKLAANVRKSGKLVSTPLSRFMRLRVAMNQGSYNEILIVANELFSNPPFHDLSNRAVLACLDYLSAQMQKPENQKDPTQMAELAKVLATNLQGNQLLTEIILSSQYKKGLATEAELLDGLKQFPDDVLLQQIAAEYLIFNGKAEQALAIIEQVRENSDGNASRLDFLHMVALDQLGHHDEAAEIFRRLVEQSEFDLDLLADYFTFCWRYERRTDLLSLADKLADAADDKLKPFADFFRAAALLLEDDEAKNQEALKLLATTPNDNPDFTFYAANKLSEADMIEEAEAKYKVLLKTYKAPALILVNLSELYHAKGDEKHALEAAKEAFDMEKKSMLPAFIYAKRLSEAERYQEAVDALKFPRHAVNYREDIVDLWTDCMHHVIENSIAGERYMQAEEQCKHLLTIAPDDEFGKENLEKVQKLIKQQNDKGHSEQTAPSA